MKWLLKINLIVAFEMLFLSLLATSVFADNVISDDQIIDGSLCVGMDCFNGEDFSFDNLRLKENNLRIHFQDTSSSLGFPSGDWRITINDSNDGGNSFFAVDDLDYGRRPFTIEYGAADNALVLDSSGNVGVGTDTPLETLHVVGNALVTGNLELGSSRNYKTNIHSLNSTEAIETLKALRPVKYNHKSQPDEEAVGFIAEEVPDLVATNSRKSLRPTDIIAVLTKVIQDQQKVIEMSSKRIDALEKQIY